MILLVDNYDSFTWNVYQAMAALGAEVEVHRNDAITVERALAMQPSAVVVSPGPGRPSEAGICPALFARLSDDVPILGVCLGHQGLVEHYGGELERDPEPTHGKASLVHHDGDRLFRGLPNPFPAGRYHSLRAKRDRLPEQLTLTAWTEDGLVISPGPGEPRDAGISERAIEALAGTVPVLGVCLGHQGLAEVYGGKVVRAGRLMHGKTSPILHRGRGLFAGLDNPFEATRYHSLIVERESLPEPLEIVAWTPEGEIMGLKHRDHETWGVQFHPESVLTRQGMQLVDNFLTLCRQHRSVPR